MIEPTADKQARPVVLSDLAERLGVSTTTVPRALNDQPGVGAATRTRIPALAAELGYRPNASARALVTGRSSVVGLIGFDIPY
ncbi:LacI family DNA-binding transcriptional regulator [Streptomyces sp. NPDC051243]|uniref:LacI family DNA-binding transcriptional regulator n=1 Tax=Streptomyces sp. NPDC051243 TaxID=3365646 RepID=UPI0037B51A09